MLLIVENTDRKVEARPRMIDPAVLTNPRTAAVPAAKTVRNTWVRPRIVVVAIWVKRRMLAMRSLLAFRSAADCWRIAARSSFV